MPVSEKRHSFGAILTILILLALLAYFVVFGIINFCGFDNFCTTDMYEDTLVARLMWEQKTLFPENFLFGNQFYVIATPVLATLFYGITGSMNLAMALATTVMSLLIMVSLSWMLKPFIKEKLIRYSALLALVSAVFGPYNVVREDGQLFFVMCSFYACYLISFFVLLGDYARARDSEEHRPAAFILALFLSFCTGMQSLRQTCVSMLPILCFELLRILTQLIKTGELKIKCMSTIRAAAYFAANLAGIVFINLLGVKRNEIYYGQSIFSGASISEKMQSLKDSLLTVSGLEFVKTGQEPFFLVIFLFFTFINIAAFIYLLRRKNFFTPTASFWWICIISIAAVIAASFVTSVSLRPIYLFPFYALPALSLVVLVPKLKAVPKYLICFLLCIIASLNLYYSYHVDLLTATGQSKSAAEEASDFIIEQGFEYVYGSHSHTAPSIAAKSDGKLIAGCWEDEVIFKVSPHINIKNIYHLSDYSKAAFVFLEQELPLAMKEADGNGAELTFLAKFGQFYVYKSSKQMMYPISENIDAAWLFPEYN